MIKNTILCLFSILVFSIQAQIQQGGIPASTLLGLKYLNNNTIHFPAVDLQKLAQEDAYFDLQKDIPYRFGYNFDVNYSTENAGEWTELPNGDRIWRLNLYSEAAQSLNFLLQDFEMAEGAHIFFYNKDKTVVLGSFNHKNNRPHKNLATMPIPGSEVTIEFYEPKAVKGKSRFELTRVTHGYRSIKVPTKAVGSSGNCNNNVICAEGDNWRNQIKSVGIIIVNGNGNCSGSLINNMCEDKTPYFLTANHCTGSDVTTWNIGFNWESTDCTNNFQNQNIGFESINVLAMRAQNAGSDFALLELVQIPPVQYNLYYAGWDRSGSFPTSQVAIHHPDGDLKKISFDNDPAGQATYSGAPCWRIFDWEDGTTEPGSSGSPLFDQNKRIIGQLYGGSANCNNNINDYYGRFDVSWNGGTDPSNELKTWLDPLESNALTLDGLDGTIVYTDEISIDFLNKPKYINCGTTIPQQILLKNNGLNTATQISFIYGLADNLQTHNWTGSIASGQSVTISFPSFSLCDGLYNYTLDITSYNGSMDEITCNNSDHFSFEVINGNQLEVAVKTNFSGDESSFEIYNSSNNILYSETSFQNNKLHNFSYCFPKGDYYFKMKDSGNNGLTPTFNIDNGYYSLTLDGIEIQNNDDFGAEEITNFSTSGNGLKANFDLPTFEADVAQLLESTSSGFISNLTWDAPLAKPSTGVGSDFKTLYSTAGSYKIKLTITNDTACTNIVKDVIVNPNTGIEKTEAFYNVQVYPNPANDFINIMLATKAEISISIQNTLGQKVYEGNILEKHNTINTKTFSKGIYYVVLSTESKTYIKKVSVK